MKKLLILCIIIFAAYGLYWNNNGEDRTFAQNAVSRILTIFNKAPFPEIVQPSRLPQDQFEAHIFMKPDSVVSISHGWIPYYYRHKRQDEIVQVVLFLAKKKDLLNNYDHFFSSLFNQHPEQLKILKEKMLTLVGEEKKAVDQIVTAAYSHTPADFTPPIAHENIWLEYAVTGSKKIIEKYAQFLDPARYSLSEEEIVTVKNHLYEAARFHYPVYAQLDLIKEGSSGEYRNHLFQVFSYVEDSVYEPSNNFWYTGDNHRKNKEYDKAITAFMQGLNIGPDNPYLYRITGEVLTSQRKFDHALASLLYARETCPRSIKESLLFSIAEIYIEQKKYHKTLEFYKQAFELDPNEPSNLYNLGWVYERLGDTVHAEKYFREMFLHDPTSYNKEGALHFFKDHNLQPPTTEVTLEDLLLTKKFNELETKLNSALLEKDLDENGILTIYSMFSELTPNSGSYTDSFSRYLEAHQAWLAVTPDSYFANASYGNFNIEYGWNARGSGYGHTITDKGRKQFHDRIRLAAKHLQKAYEIDPSHSYVPVRMMTVAKVHPDWYDSEVEVWFQKALQANPSDCNAYTKKSYFLEPKWGGSRQQQFAFARDTLRNGPKTSMAPVILAKIHWSIYHRSNDPDYFANPTVWNEMKEVQDELIRRFPHSNERHNWFAKSACLARDFETARREFKVIGENWLQGTWSTFEYFEFYKNLAFNEEQ